MKKSLAVIWVAFTLLAPGAEAAQNAWTVTGPLGGGTSDMIRI